MSRAARRLILLAMSLGCTASLAAFAEGAAREAMLPAREVTDVLARSVLAGIIEAAPYAHHASTFLAFCALAAAVAVVANQVGGKGGAT